MNLRQVAAGGSRRFPDIRYRIQPDDIHAVVAQVQHIVRHVVEHNGIGIVQVPLVGIEHGHDHFLCFLAPGEIARCCGREHLGHSLFIPVGNIPAVIEKIAVLVFRLSRPGPACPLMVFAGMVHHKVQAQGNTSPVALVRQFLQVVHRSQLRLHFPEIAHGVPAVAPSCRAFQQRHQVKIADSAFLHIIQLVLHALQRSGKSLHIHLHTGQVLLPVPVRAGLPFPVKLPEAFRPVFPGVADHLRKVFPRLQVIVIQLHIKPLQFVRVAGKPNVKFLIQVLFIHVVTSALPYRKQRPH